MVSIPNPRLLVHGACAIHLTTDGRQKITNGPVYDLQIVQVLAAQHGLRVVNDDAIADQAKFQPSLEDDELRDFLLALYPERHAESERCCTSVGIGIDCDAYTLHWHRTRRCEWGHGQKLYVKFGFRENNPRCLVASIHPSKW